MNFSSLHSQRGFFAIFRINQTYEFVNNLGILVAYLEIINVSDNTELVILHYLVVPARFEWIGSETVFF